MKKIIKYNVSDLVKLYSLDNILGLVKLYILDITFIFILGQLQLTYKI